MPALNNRYVIQKLIGTGGMAEVYKATDTTLDRDVAIKVLKPEFAADEDFAKGFLEEAKSAASLNSPNIASVHDCEREGDYYYIVMEYVKGIDLARILKNYRAIPPVNTALIMIQICDALALAHSKGIIHQDIKAANIMVRKLDSVGNIEAKLMDFGIARRGKTSTLTHDRILGTIQYMSPEQIQHKKTTPASDLYSLGVVMYEMCTGTLPFVGETPHDIAEKHLRRNPIEPMLLNEEVDELFSGIIKKAMRKRPADRFESASDLKDTLRKYLSIRGQIKPSGLDYPKQWALILTRAPERSLGTVQFFNKPIIIGSSGECFMSIPDPSVSPRHLAIIPRGMFLEVKDLHSENGTQCNGIPLKTRIFCQPGDEIAIGRIKFRFGKK